jgi:LacI family transcriptional regulator
LADVAREAGVSVKTASRVINQERWVSEATRRRVDQAIGKLGFRPSLNARALAGTRSFIVAFIYDVIAPTEIAAALTGAIKRCRLADYHVLVDQVTTVSPDVGDHVARLVSSAHLDGIILAPPVSDSMAVLDTLERSGIPYVRMAPYRDLGRSPYVAINDFRAAFEMTSHLINLGHREIGFVKGDPNHGASHARHDGFLASMRHSGCRVAPEWVFQGDFTFSSGVAAFDEFRSQAAAPTAIFASNDMMALGICATAQSRGVSVPADLSVAGFDDVPGAASAHPALTTVRQSFLDMATAAADYLIELAGNAKSTEPTFKILDFEIVVRGSTAAPRRAATTG